MCAAVTENHLQNLRPASVAFLSLHRKPVAPKRCINTSAVVCDCHHIICKHVKRERAFSCPCRCSSCHPSLPPLALPLLAMVLLPRTSPTVTQTSPTRTTTTRATTTRRRRRRAPSTRRAGHRTSTMMTILSPQTHQSGLSGRPVGDI